MQKLRYLYNPSKCVVVVFNEQGHKHQHSFKLGPDPIPIAEKYTHLGIVCDSALATKGSIQEASVKLRWTYCNICGTGISSENVSAKTLMTIYTTAILPKAMSGCELWNNCAASDLARLEYINSV
ncbi:hypothetical protein DPMN_154485 [Dreissena polymorpha]|uniref:Uncharacterized protein n=1 Tax=Dreissena polymorpha TaxID=45954 RepID=A0A9D4JAE8_DREPO|nr:hypothetical protein DPMN_154485 [Dreissena polymorpha]